MRVHPATVDVDINKLNRALLSRLSSGISRILDGPRARVGNEVVPVVVNGNERDYSIYFVQLGPDLPEVIVLMADDDWHRIVVVEAANPWKVRQKFYLPDDKQEEIKLSSFE